MDPTDQLRAVAIPLAGADPALPEDDLAPLLQRLAGARLIGLGEATHGDHESFAFKCRLIQALVRRGRCDVVIFERGVAEMDIYDRYVTGATDALPMGEELYPWIVEEVRDLLRWLRTWNGAGGSVRFAGMDMQSSQGIASALTLLETQGIATPSGWRQLAAEASEAGRPARWYAGALERWRQTIPPPLDLQEGHHRWIALLAETFRQWLELRLLAQQPNSRPWVLRDRYMAQNAFSQLARFGPASTAVIWAHNGHVGRFGRPEGEHPSDGTLLRQSLGVGYRAVGFAFGGGQFRAASPGADHQTDWTLRVHTAHRPPADTLEALLDPAGLECFAIEPTSVARCRQSMRLREISAVSAADWEQFKVQAVPADVYDLLVYFRAVQPSRPLAKIA